MDYKSDDLWIWVTIENEKINKLRKEIDQKYSLAREPETILYHYTNANGLKGTIDSKSLWLTNINYMNDADELSYAQNLIKGVVQDFEKEHKGHKEFFERLKWLSDPFENSFDIYITCFCEDGRLLSQWKNYGIYSLGFNTEKPFRVNPSTFRFEGNYHKAILRKVEYDKDKQIEIITEIIKGIFNLYRKKLESSERKTEMVAQIYARVFANFYNGVCFRFQG